MLVYSTKPENKSGLFLLLLSVAATFVLVYIVIEERTLLFDLNRNSDLVIVVLLVLIICTMIHYVLDEAIWQLFGEERCECDNEAIVITKRRLLKRRKVISYGDISSITEYVPNTLWQIVTYFTIAGMSQDTIMIRYGRNRKYSCGANLNKRQIQKTMETLTMYMGNIR